MAKILQNSKLTNGWDSVLYQSVRNKFDNECASESKEHIRQMLEAFSDLIGEEIRSDSELCRLCLAADKTLNELYKIVEEEARKLCSPAPGKLSSCAMHQSQVMALARIYYGFDTVNTDSDMGEGVSDSSSEKQSDKSSEFRATSLFDLL